MFFRGLARAGSLYFQILLAILRKERDGAGGRGWDRTSDPYDVNVVLSR
jgi:hypothetical protein